MRPIDADALDKVLNEAQIKCKRNAGNFRYGVLNNVRANLEKAPTVNGWINVKDRLPEKDQTVIIYGSWVGVSGTVYEETQFISMDEAIYKGFTPIAWMPLPEPPKE